MISVAKKLKNQVKERLAPYMFFWDEWIKNGNCNLDPNEIKLIAACIYGDVNSSLLEDQSYNNTVEGLNQVILKMEIGFQVFKDFVIVNFLQTIIDMANNYGYQSFLSTPIRQLNIDEDLKLCLLKLKAHTLQIAFIIYQADDFNRRWLFEIIVEFQSVFKAKTLLSTSKTIAV